MSGLTEEMAKERFESDTAEHEMTVLHDDGLYRHLRFRRKETWAYGFDIVTWPGYLYIGGDIEDYVFARCPDMFDWFEGGAHGVGINPHYWAQKLQGADARQSGGRRYGERAFKAAVLEWARIELEEYGLAEEVYPSLLIGALEREVLRGIPGHQEEAREVLEDFHWLFGETWEWDLTEYDLWFLWACWAVVWGIGKYRLHEMAVAA